jgi:putative endonuclease
MTLTSLETGRKGEALAAAYLTTQGYQIMARNFRARTAEIDIIAKEGSWLCFVEVKTRTSVKKGLPKESVHPAKQRRLIAGAAFYIRKHRLFNQRIRFDVVEVMLTDPPEITLIRHAFTGV